MGQHITEFGSYLTVDTILETINYHGEVCREVKLVHELWFLAAGSAPGTLIWGRSLSTATEGDTTHHLVH